MTHSLTISTLPIGTLGGASCASEDELNLKAPRNSIGLCLSGGGSRALTCAMGQLRALHHLGLMGNIFAISSVSGGTWANALYTYLPAHISDTDFLGTPVLDPSKLTLLGTEPHSLDYLSTNNLGNVPTRMGIFDDLSEITYLKAAWGYSTNDLWQGLIGHSVLRPFGLWQPDPAKGHHDQHYFSWTKSYLNYGPLRDNPSLSSRDFYTVDRKRPFMVFNTSLFTDITATADLVPFEANFMLGVRQEFPATGSTTIGGGFIGSLGMGSSYTQDLTGNDIQTTVPARPYTLSDIVGCSSMALAQMLEEKFTSLKGLVPTYEYFPVENRKTVQAVPYKFADGGSLENLGVNVMLARGLARLLVGVNTDEGVTKNATTGEITISSDIPPLFGYQPSPDSSGKYVPYSPTNPGTGAARLFRHNQVFPSSQFDTLRQALWNKKANGLPLVVRQTLTVLPNSWYGVAGHTSVDILWMYNDMVDAFWKQLHFDVRMAIDALGAGQFPRYGTVSQLKLDAVEVNALAHMWCWNLAADWRPDHSSATNADVVRGMFR